MTQTNQKIGWIGMGRMGFSMAERLVKAGYDLSVWNRTKSKAEPLAKSGAKIVDKLADLAGVDVLFSIVSAGPDLDDEVGVSDLGLLDELSGDPVASKEVLAARCFLRRPVPRRDHGGSP